MNDPEDRDDLNLDAALRAAFEDVDAPDPPSGESALATLENSVGPCTRVLLRDTDSEEIVRPIAKDLVSASFDGSRYQVVGEIARGGVGIVMKSRDVDLGRDVAMKVLKPEHEDSPAMVHRFVEEAQIAGQLQHPGILPVYELGVRGEHTPYFTMKLVRGETLSALLADRKSPADERSRWLKIFDSITQTLAYAHAKGVIHRDLKPSNILVGSFGEVQVVDWGLAKVLTRGGIADEALAPRSDESVAIETVRSTDTGTESLVGSVLGTPAYMAPEQARGEVERLDERCDVFALGAMLCEILTGKPPFSGSRHTVLDQARAGDLTEVFERIDRSDADEGLARIAKRCLSPVISERPRNANVVSEELTSYLASVQQRARAAELARAQAETRVEEERHRRRWVVTAALLGVLFLAMLAGGGLWYQDQSNRRTQNESARLNSKIDRATELLSMATAAPVGEKDSWLETQAVANSIEDSLESGSLDSGTRDRATTFLDSLQLAQQHRQLSETLEEAVITGATHLDAKSWLRMERELREAFLGLGIDVLAPNDEIVKRMRESPLSVQLADGFELWVGTGGHLHSFGASPYTFEELYEKTKVLNRVDKDPFSVRVRQLLWEETPTTEAVAELLDGADLSKVRPRTLSWLAGICYRTGDKETVHRLFHRAFLTDSDDFMLNFDYAFHLVSMNDHREAIRYFMRCLAIRPNSSGIWRCLGNSQRQTDELDSSAEALQRAIALEPEHAPTYVDYGHTLLKQGKKGKAREAYQKALKLDAELKAAQDALEQLGD